jgi:hypothetical protein
VHKPKVILSLYFFIPSILFVAKVESGSIRKNRAVSSKL